MQRTPHVLYELDRAVGTRCIRNCELETPFVGGSSNGCIVICLSRDERIEVHLAHLGEVKLKSTDMTDGFLKFGSDRFANCENHRIRASCGAARAAR